jgi:pyruvate/2-oxoglutarate dehydrogenase complex dihydrolipoamide acyltransferase (E2) component
MWDTHERATLVVELHSRLTNRVRSTTHASPLVRRELRHFGLDLHDLAGSSHHARTLLVPVHRRLDEEEHAAAAHHFVKTLLWQLDRAGWFTSVRVRIRP